jgi:hypothetical protein
MALLLLPVVLLTAYKVAHFVWGMTIMMIAFFLIWWIVTDVSYSSVSSSNGVTVTVRYHSPLLLIAYKNGGEVDLLVTRAISHTRCKQHIPVPPSASTEIVGDRPPKSLYSRLLTSSARPALLRLHPVLRQRRRSRDCTAYTFPYRICTTTSNIHTRCLVWMKLLMPWASVPPHCTFCFSYLRMYHLCLLLIWVVIHKCTYMSSHISHCYSRLNLN